MITRKIIKKILPNALPLAAILISVTYSWQSLAKETDNSTESSVDSATPCSIPLTAPCNGRIRDLIYERSSVYVIRTKFGYQTNIIFDPKEEIQTLSVGDRSLWQLIPTGNRLYIRPMNDNLSTNMTLITNKRSYEFELKSVGKRSESNIYVARFSYPSEQEQVGTSGLESSIGNQYSAISTPVGVNVIDTQHTLESPPSINNSMTSSGTEQTSINPPTMRPNYSYTYVGPDELAPLQVYDDGKLTFIKYQAIDQIAPTAFIIDQNGKESPAYTTRQGSSLVIDGVTSELALRSSGGEIRVYNESLSQR
ncbi:MAG: TrbG/VirB9 family P-type conjugative transfer protein [Rickettsiales bacterium]|jgi:type IV secretion system protein VirB9